MRLPPERANDAQADRESVSTRHTRAPAATTVANTFTDVR